MLDNGHLLPGIAAVLQEWPDFAEWTFDTRPDAIGESTSYLRFCPLTAQFCNPFRSFTVYIATSPSVAYGRITRRARGEETTVPYEYIVQLDLLHNAWITREHDAMMAEETWNTTVSKIEAS